MLGVQDFIDRGHADDITAAVLAHHEWFDGRGGYPILLRPSLHLFSRIQEVEVFSADTRATAVVQVAMTARPVEAPEILLQLKADLYRFEVQLAWDQDEEAWRIVGSSWRRANLAALGG